jgi:hypothetical protein
MTFAELKQRLDLYEKLMRLDKPRHTALRRVAQSIKI